MPGRNSRGLRISTSFLARGREGEPVRKLGLILKTLLFLPGNTSCLVLKDEFSRKLTLDEAELDGEFGRNLGDDVGGDVAGDERRVPHHVVHGVGHLHQLAVGEI